MKKIIKNTTLVGLLLLVILVVGIGQANAVKYSKSPGWGYVDCESSHGSPIVKNYRWKAGYRKGPFEVFASTPCGVVAGQPTKLVVKYVYRPKAQLGLSGGGRPTYGRYYGKGGASGLSVERQEFIANYSTADSSRKLKAMKPNRVRTATFWLNLPCVAVSSINMPTVFPRYPIYPTPAIIVGWGECMPTSIYITLHVGRIGKIGRRLAGTRDVDVDLSSVYIYPAPSQTTPTEPTGPTG